MTKLRWIRNTIPLIILALLLPGILLSFPVIVDSVGQRTDGSKLWDIWYSFSGVSGSDSVRVELIPLMESGETLPCNTFLVGSMPASNGEYIPAWEDISFHIVWDFGTDVPDREFRKDKILIRILAMVPEVESDTFTIEIRVAAGDAFSMVIKELDSTLWSWGYNNRGQLGGGPFGGMRGGEDYDPLYVVGPSGSVTDTFDGILGIAAGAAHSLAVRYDGTVWAWGDNAQGQLGDPAVSDVIVYIPSKVTGGDAGGAYLDNITMVAGGDELSAALRDDGAVFAWGSSQYGQCGTGEMGTSYSEPKVVIGIDSVVALAAGDDHLLMLRSDGTVWTCGRNLYGQLGDNSTDDRPTPVQVFDISGSVLDDIIAIAGGGNFSLALRADSTVWGWGNNGLGQLGTGGTGPFQTRAIQVIGAGGVGVLDDIIAIAAGWRHTLALKADSTVYAWGGNYYGQLGNGVNGGSEGSYDPGIDSNIPIPVPGLSGIMELAAGRFHSLALRTNDRQVLVWGRNHRGQLGIGVTSDYEDTPQATDLPAGWWE